MGTTAVGIDLGTTFSAIACLSPGDQKPRIIPNEAGRGITPSVVCWVDGRLAVGDDAKECQANGHSALAFFKRAMGDPYFVVELGGRSYTAVGLSALVLGALRDQASQYLNETVREAVITVPAYFTNVRREATIQAGREAGLEVLSILSEPTAAALAYGLRPGAPGAVLVYDLGGGTFDVSLVAITDTQLRVVATDGDHSLGGKDWDDRLLYWVAEQFDREVGGDLLGSMRDDALIAAENAKRALSAREQTTISIGDRTHTRQYTVTRERF
jgi:molecular chaperone DnaK